MFQSDLEVIKEYTLLIQEESEDDDEEIAKDSLEATEEAAAEEAEQVAQVAAPVVEEKKAPASKKGKKPEPVAAPVEVEDPNKKPDLNAGKLIPGIVHLKRDLVSTIQQM